MHHLPSSIRETLIDALMVAAAYRPETSSEPDSSLEPHRSYAPLSLWLVDLIRPDVVVDLNRFTHGALSEYSGPAIDLLTLDATPVPGALYPLEQWLPRLSDRGVVIVYGIDLESDSGNSSGNTIPGWSELSARYPSFQLKIGKGAGVLLVGTGVHQVLREIADIFKQSKKEFSAIDQVFSGLADLVSDSHDRDRLHHLEAEHSALAREVQRLKDSLSVKDFLVSHLSLCHQAEVRRSQELSEYQRLLHDWRCRIEAQMAELQDSSSWKLMQMIRRFGSLVVRGEDEGRAGFVRWIWSWVRHSEYPLRRSYDPVKDALDLAPPLPVSSYQHDLNTQDTGAPGAASAVIEVTEPPVMRHRGQPGRQGTVDVIIPLKGSINWLGQCLGQLIRTTPAGFISNIIVVDDGSSIDEQAVLEELCAHYPNLTIIENVSPKGFAGACNAGAAISSAPYLLFLNSDCLVTRSTIPALVQCCEDDAAVGLVTALSNNAGTLSVDLPAGLSFMEASEALSTLRADTEKRERFVEACTVVGHCLLARQGCFRAVGGFDTSWGLGYGEETDLQMRAREKGYRGVVPLDTYVYHFGGGTFKYESSRAALQATNHARFLRVWGEQYRELAQESSGFDPVRLASDAIRAAAEKPQRPDVLFVLPGLRHAVGGVMAVLDLCNYLVMHGVDAKALILGELNRDVLRNYPEALYIAPFHVRSGDELLSLGAKLQPKVVVGTLFTTVQPAIQFATACGASFVNFVQGYEFYFDNGIHYAEVRDSYRMSEICLVTSSWLAKGIERHSSRSSIYLLPLGVDGCTNFPKATSKSPLRPISRKIRVGIVLRHSPDKGQWILRDVVDQITGLRSQIALTIFSSARDLHGLNQAWSDAGDTQHVVLPLDRYRMASFVRECDVLVDASLHEGFGLVPLEAMANGCTVIASNSGGVCQFLKDGVNGLLIDASTQPERYVAAIESLVRDRALLERLQQGAIETGKTFTMDRCYEDYRRFFAAIAEKDLARIEDMTAQARMKPGSGGQGKRGSFYSAA